MIPRSTDGKTRVLALSYGKDSMACLGALEKLQWPLDRIVTADVWATDTIPADPPTMMEFKEYADREILERYGITVEHYSAMDKDGNKVTYNSLFYRGYKPETVAKRARAGKKFDYYDPGRVIWGFPVVQGPWCNSGLKVAALNQAKKATKDSITIVGIAADEPIRIERAKKKHQLLPLVEVGWTEADCWKWSEEHGLLSPTYKQATRGGCWFCHNQSVGQLRLLRRQYPDLWAMMMEWDNDSPVRFHADGRTIHDFDRRFQLEDAGLIDPTEPWKWTKLEEELNYRWF